MTIDHSLSTLETSGLIRIAQIEPEMEYLFRHALVQTAAYESLLRKDRALLHRAVGEALEATYPDRLEELAPTLARHFDAAGMAHRALAYHIQAGDLAARQFANEIAIRHYSRALELAESASASHRQIRHVYGRLGRTLELANDYVAALAMYRRMEAEGLRCSDLRMELEALSARAAIQCTPNPYFNLEEAGTGIARALKVAETLGDREIQARLYWNLMLAHLYTFGEEHGAAAVEAGERSLVICREMDVSEQLAYTLNDLYGAYCRAGTIEQAQQVNAEARDLWRHFGNIPMLVDALSASCAAHFRLGEYDALLVASDAGYELAGSIGHGWGQAASRAFNSLVYFERGLPDSAIACDEDAIHIGMPSGYPGVLTVIPGNLGWTLCQLGAVERGLALTQQALDMARTHFGFMLPLILSVHTRLMIAAGDLDAASDLVVECWRENRGTISYFDMSAMVHLAAAEFALARGDYSQALDYADQELAYLNRLQYRSLKPQTLHVKGQALYHMGDLDAAETTLREGLAAGEVLGSQWTRWQLLASLADVLTERDMLQDAINLRREAQSIVRSIADRIPTQDLRASFLAQPQVRQIADAELDQS